MDTSTVKSGNYLKLIIQEGIPPCDERQIKTSELLALEENPHWAEPIELDEQWLLDFNFKKHKSLILDSYSISITDNEFEFKEISVNIEAGNQYIYLRQGDVKGKRHEDDVVTIFNGDKNGKLFVHILQNIYLYLTFKELEKI